MRPTPSDDTLPNTLHWLYRSTGAPHWQVATWTGEGWNLLTGKIVAPGDELLVWWDYAAPAKPPDAFQLTDIDISREGGPAFPVSIPGCGDNGWHGMTLRDWFAAVAAQGMLPGNRISGKEVLENAHLAYRMADAMLEARKHMKGPR